MLRLRPAIFVLESSCFVRPFFICKCFFFFYIENRTSLPSLSPGQLTKLKHLTIVSLASQCRVRGKSTGGRGKVEEGKKWEEEKERERERWLRRGWRADDIWRMYNN